MSALVTDQIVKTIRELGAARTPVLAQTFGMSEALVERALWPLCVPGGPLVSCVVEVAGQRVKEYRASAIGGGKLNDTFTPVGRPRTAVEKKPDPAFGSARAVTQALAARFKSASPAPVAPKPTTPRKEVDAPMSTTTDKIIAAIRKHGPMTSAQLRDHVKDQNATTICGQLARKGKLVKLGGGYRTTIYGVDGQKPPAGAAQSRKQKKRAEGGRATPMRKTTVNAGTFRPAIASDGALLLMGAATPGELSPAETRVLAEFLRRVDRTGVRA